MLVDSIEAASRTVWPPEHKKFEEMIQRVIFTKLAAGQLDESGLSLEDLRVITARMASTLVNVYHGRIKYPWQREAEQRAAEKPHAEPKNGTPEPAKVEAAKAEPAKAEPVADKPAQDKPAVELVKPAEPAKPPVEKPAA
jgi:hypothetical protein